MRTAKQGSLDGLCGLYSVVNAVDLVIGIEQGSTLPKELFLQLVHGLGAAALLNSMVYGVEADPLEQTTALAFGWLSDVYGEALIVERPFLNRPPKTMASYLSRLRKLISMPETAVIISIRNPEIDHWSVVTKVERSVLRFRDSDGLRALDVADYQLENGPVCISPANTLIIRRQPFRWMRRVGPGELAQIETPPRQDVAAINAAMDELDRLGQAKPVPKHGPLRDENSFIKRGDKIYQLDALAAALAQMNKPKEPG